MAAPPPTKLDANQVLKAAFDEANGRLRTDAVISGDIIVSDINISHVDDSIRLGDGTKLVTATTVGSNVGLDVNVLNDIEIEIDAADGDNIAISDGTNTLDINPDGSISVNVLNTATDNLDVIYDEVTSVGTSILTTINSHTAIVDQKLDSISVSGTNTAMYEVVLNASVIEKKRTYFGGNLNCEFNLEGLDLSIGDIILVRVIHERPNVGDFNATIKVIT